MANLSWCLTDSTLTYVFIHSCNFLLFFKLKFNVQQLFLTTSKIGEAFNLDRVCDWTTCSFSCRVYDQGTFTIQASINSQSRWSCGSRSGRRGFTKVQDFRRKRPLRPRTERSYLEYQILSRKLKNIISPFVEGFLYSVMGSSLFWLLFVSPFSTYRGVRNT